MKRASLTIAFCIVSSVAFAQQQEFNLKLTAPEVETIGKALGKLPYEEVAILVNKLRQQIVEQQTKSVPVNPPSEPKKE
jgi:hypothetical protein